MFANTDANIFLTIFGRTEKDEFLKTDECLLQDYSRRLFERGACDRFERLLNYVGTPYKIIVRHDGSNTFSNWHLSYVRLVNKVTKVLIFTIYFIF